MGSRRRLPRLRGEGSASSPGWEALEALCSMPARTELTGAGERVGGEGEAVSRGPKYTPAEGGGSWLAEQVHDEAGDRELRSDERGGLNPQGAVHARFEAGEVGFRGGA